MMIPFNRKAADLVVGDGLLCRVATNFGFTEGPVWDPRAKTLWFSDITGDTTYGYEEPHGLVVVRRHPSGKANGLAMDDRGRLVACEHGARRVSREDARGTWVTLADSYGGKRLNSPNDVALRSDGVMFFTDPPYGLDPSEGGFGVQEQPVQGVYRLGPGEEGLALVADDFDRPNGLAFDPTERFLYIDDTARQHVRRFEVDRDGNLGGGEIWARLDPKVGPGVADGMCIDIAGNVFVTGPGGVWVFGPDGDSLGVVRVPEVAANVAWGGSTLRTLYVTATHSLYALECQTMGKPSSGGIGGFGADQDDEGPPGTPTSREGLSAMTASGS